MAIRNRKSRSAKAGIVNAQPAAISPVKFDAEFAATSKLSRAIESMRKGAEKDRSLPRLELTHSLASLMDEYEGRISAIEQRM